MYVIYQKQNNLNSECFLSKNENHLSHLGNRLIPKTLSQTNFVR